MLNHSFSHIPSIGAATEEKIWKSGVYSQDDFLRTPPPFLTRTRQQRIHEHILKTRECLRNRDASFFCENLPTKEHWRIFSEYRNEAAYLDIETTGLGSPDDVITTIALYDGEQIRYYVRGTNLNDFPQDIFDYKLLVTFNGKTFDIPFIERYFGIRLNHAHLDLRYILRGLGYSGGLKSCERQMGIRRADGLEDVDGFFAVLLWQDYIRRLEKRALETLLCYNIEDVLHLECLMIEAYNRKVDELPFRLEPIVMPPRPENPFKADRSVIERIRGRMYRNFRTG